MTGGVVGRGRSGAEPSTLARRGGEQGASPQVGALPTRPVPHSLPPSGSFVVDTADGRSVSVTVNRAQVPAVVGWVPWWLASVVVVVGPVVLSAALMWLGTR